MTNTEKIKAIAELMGWKAYDLNTHGYDAHAYEERPHEHRLIENVEHKWVYFAPGNPKGVVFDPLTSIADAFLVVERMRELGWCMRLMRGIVGTEVTFYPEQRSPAEFVCGARSATAPEAIVDAALAAWGAK